jgi:hypothetical protein
MLQVANEAAVSRQLDSAISLVNHEVKDSLRKHIMFNIQVVPRVEISEAMDKAGFLVPEH